ncbi:NADH dehydrogenase [ubiquinone] flavoprotein 3, mitochondrial [Popillia japonica]|uniref:NADH dehydrogenase [ubiquinone] flavoprotein 3, mitochondrial n=1 Tax=Popillia japonica TaxID=7064 RepID=A0AAW1MGN0_POPJA
MNNLCRFGNLALEGRKTSMACCRCSSNLRCKSVKLKRDKNSRFKRRNFENRAVLNAVPPLEVLNSILTTSIGSCGSQGCDSMNFATKATTELILPHKYEARTNPGERAYIINVFLNEQKSDRKDTADEDCLDVRIEDIDVRPDQVCMRKLTENIHKNYEEIDRILKRDLSTTKSGKVYLANELKRVWSDVFKRSKSEEVIPLKQLKEEDDYVEDNTFRDVKGSANLNDEAYEAIHPKGEEIKFPNNPPPPPPVLPTSITKNPIQAPSRNKVKEIVKNIEKTNIKPPKHNLKINKTIPTSQEIFDPDPYTDDIELEKSLVQEQINKFKSTVDTSQPEPPPTLNSSQKLRREFIEVLPPDINAENSTKIRPVIIQDRSPRIPPINLIRYQPTNTTRAIIKKHNNQETPIGNQETPIGSIGSVDEIFGSQYAFQRKSGIRERILPSPQTNLLKTGEKKLSYVCRGFGPKRFYSDECKDEKSASDCEPQNNKCESEEDVKKISSGVIGCTSKCLANRVPNEPADPDPVPEPCPQDDCDPRYKFQVKPAVPKCDIMDEIGQYVNNEKAAEEIECYYGDNGYKNLEYFKFYPTSFYDIQRHLASKRNAQPDPYAHKRLKPKILKKKGVCP